MKSIEIISITLLVIIGFIASNFFVDYLMLKGALVRFVVRIGFQAQIIVLVYLFFDSRDNARRLRANEYRFARDDVQELKNTHSEEKVKNNNGR